MAYKCRDCGEVFDEPRQYTDWVEFWGSNVPMYSYTCPCCDSDNYDDREIVESEEEHDMTIEELMEDYDNGIIHVVESGKLKEGEYELEDED